jgi:hypothetical protein
MMSKIKAWLLLALLSTPLAACDKCNDLQQIQLPLRPNACKDAAAR